MRKGNETVPPLIQPFSPYSELFTPRCVCFFEDDYYMDPPQRVSGRPGGGKKALKVPRLFP